jgi:PHD/YefM family antitoxin component YafN of YafNO toxin-antitoxin module
MMWCVRQPVRTRPALEMTVTITKLSSRAFGKDVSSARKAASKGPVFITDHGKPTHVLLTIEDYRRLTGAQMSLLKALEQRESEADFAFVPPKSKILPRPAKLG